MRSLCAAQAPGLAWHGMAYAHIGHIGRRGFAGRLLYHPALWPRSARACTCAGWVLKFCYTFSSDPACELSAAAGSMPWGCGPSGPCAATVLIAGLAHRGTDSGGRAIPCRRVDGRRPCWMHIHPYIHTECVVWTTRMLRPCWMEQGCMASCTTCVVHARGACMHAPTHALMHGTAWQSAGSACML